MIPDRIAPARSSSRSTAALSTSEVTFSPPWIHPSSRGNPAVGPLDKTSRHVAHVGKP